MYEPIIAGSIAGGAGYIGTLPFDYIKQHSQTGDKRILNTLKENGFRTLFRGGLVGSCSIVPQMVIKFTTNDYLKKNTHNSPFVNGFISGYVDGSFLGPILAIQSIQQMKVKYGYREALSLIGKNRHLISLSIPLALRNGTYTSTLFGGYPLLKRESSDSMKFANNFLVSSFLNIPAVIACSPFDVIRAKQTQYMLENKSFHPMDIAIDILQKQGTRGFYQGFGSLYVNFALRFPLTFAIFYQLMDDFDSNREEI